MTPCFCVPKGGLERSSAPFAFFEVSPVYFYCGNEAARKEITK